MRAHRIGTVRKIEARLRAYRDALQCGFTCEEAMREAKVITSRTLRKKKQAKEAGR